MIVDTEAHLIPQASSQSKPPCELSEVESWKTVQPKTSEAVNTDSSPTGDKHTKPCSERQETNTHNSTEITRAPKESTSEQNNNHNRPNDFPGNEAKSCESKQCTSNSTLGYKDKSNDVDNISQKTKSKQKQSCISYKSVPSQRTDRRKSSENSEEHVSQSKENSKSRTGGKRSLHGMETQEIQEKSHNMEERSVQKKCVPGEKDKTVAVVKTTKSTHEMQSIRSDKGQQVTCDMPENKAEVDMNKCMQSTGSLDPEQSMSLFIKEEQGKEPHSDTNTRKRSYTRPQVSEEDNQLNESLNTSQFQDYFENDIKEYIGDISHTLDIEEEQPKLFKPQDSIDELEEDVFGAIMSPPYKPVCEPLSADEEETEAALDTQVIYFNSATDVSDSRPENQEAIIHQTNMDSQVDAESSIFGGNIIGNSMKCESEWNNSESIETFDRPTTPPEIHYSSELYEVISSEEEVAEVEVMDSAEQCQSPTPGTGFDDFIPATESMENLADNGMHEVTSDVLTLHENSPPSRPDTPDITCETVADEESIEILTEDDKSCENKQKKRQKHKSKKSSNDTNNKQSKKKRKQKSRQLKEQLTLKRYKREMEKIEMDMVGIKECAKVRPTNKDIEDDLLSKEPSFNGTITVENCEQIITNEENVFNNIDDLNHVPEEGEYSESDTLVVSDVDNGVREVVESPSKIDVYDRLPKSYRDVVRKVSRSREENKDVESKSSSRENDRKRSKRSREKHREEHTKIHRSKSRSRLKEREHSRRGNSKDTISRYKSTSHKYSRSPEREKRSAKRTELGSSTEGSGLRNTVCSRKRKRSMSPRSASREDSITLSRSSRREPARSRTNTHSRRLFRSSSRESLRSPKTDRSSKRIRMSPRSRGRDDVRSLSRSSSRSRKSTHSKLPYISSSREPSRSPKADHYIFMEQNNNGFYESITSDEEGVNSTELQKSPTCVTDIDDYVIGTKSGSNSAYSSTRSRSPSLDTLRSRRVDRGRRRVRRISSASSDRSKSTDNLDKNDPIELEVSTETSRASNTVDSAGKDSRKTSESNEEGLSPLQYTPRSRKRKSRFKLKRFIKSTDKTRRKLTDTAENSDNEHEQITSAKYTGHKLSSSVPQESKPVSSSIVHSAGNDTRKVCELTDEDFLYSQFILQARRMTSSLSDQLSPSQLTPLSSKMSKEEARRERRRQRKRSRFKIPNKLSERKKWLEDSGTMWCEDEESYASVRRSSRLTGKSDASEIGNKSASETGNKSASETGNKSTSETGNKSTSETSNKSASETGNKSTSETSNRSASETSNKSASGTSNKSTSETGNKSARKTGNKSASETGSIPAREIGNKPKHKSASIIESHDPLTIYAEIRRQEERMELLRLLNDYTEVNNLLV